MDWPGLRALMLAPKPALRCTGYAIGKDPVTVVYDGDGGLMLLSGAPLDGAGWLRSAIEPARFAALAAAEGAVTGAERIGARSTTIAEVAGLRGGSATIRVWVDDEIGCILRMERTDDPAPLVVLDGLVVEGS